MIDTFPGFSSDAWEGLLHFDAVVSTPQSPAEHRGAAASTLENLGYALTGVVEAVIDVDLAGLLSDGTRTEWV